jgi:hypothetical protein
MGCGWKQNQVEHPRLTRRSRVETISKIAELRKGTPMASVDLEQKVALLEAEVATLKAELGTASKKQYPWSVVLTHDATLLSKNRSDFRRPPV